MNNICIYILAGLGVAWTLILLAYIIHQFIKDAVKDAMRELDAEDQKGRDQECPEKKQKLG